MLGHLTLGQQLVAERAAATGARSRSRSSTRSRTASSPITVPRPCPDAGSAPLEALALFRLNALDAGVKGALEHGL